MANESKKSCFIICPIGENDSSIRAWSDDIFSGLLSPVASEYGYYARRAIDDSRPGEITTNIIDDIISADLVIADLTYHNANVFYELALRHAQAKPFLHVAEVGTKIPFDISTINTVFIDRSSIKAIDKTRVDLRTQLKAIEAETCSFDNPVKRHQQKLKADQSGDPVEARILALEEQFASLNRTIGQKRGGLSGLLKALDQNRFSSVNEKITQSTDEEIRQILRTGVFEFTFNPETNSKKYITFSNDGQIQEGRNNNEFGWRIADGRLEIIDSTGELYSRFIYVPSEKTFYHTNDPDTKSIRGQRIVFVL